MRKGQRKRQAIQVKVKPKNASIQTQNSASKSSRFTTHSVFGSPILWISLGLILANLIIYAQVWHYDFVNFDDDDYIYLNPKVTAGLTWSGLLWGLTTQHQANWHPLTWLSHMLDAQLYGLNAGGHHATSVLLHIMNSLMLFWLLHRMTTDLHRSAFVAALFAVHPLHVESVAWVAERKDVLSTFILMLTIWAYLAHVRERGLGKYVLIVLFFALGLMAKSMLVTLPFVLLLLDFWPLGRITIGTDARGNSEAGQGRVLLQLVREKIPLFVLTIGSSVITFIVQQRGQAVTSFDSLPINVRVANALISYVEYIAKFFWPTRLAALYPYSSQRSISWGFAFFILFALSVLAIAVARRYRYIPVGWFWFLGTLVPVIGLVQVGSQSMADRYTYIPLIGLSLIVAWGGPDLLARLPYRKPILVVVSGLAISSCVIVASFQVQYWKNTLVLWGRALEVTRNNYMAHHGLAAELGLLGRNEEAIAHLQEALRIKPNFTYAQYNLGIEFVHLGKLDEASTHFSEAIRLDPSYASAHNNLGNIFFTKGRLSEAAAEYSEALRLMPDYIDARSNLASVLLKQGKIDEAKRELLKVLKLSPTHPNAQQMLRGLSGHDVKSRVTTP